MALRDKFLDEASNQQSVLVCASTHHMLEANQRLKEGRIKTELVPTPQGIGSACTTAIRFSREQEHKVEQLLNQATGIEWEDIYPIEKKDRREDWQDLLELDLRDKFKKTLSRVAQDEVLSKSEVITLLEAESDDELEALFESANRMRQEMVSDMVDIRAAIEFSNYCTKNCNYCGLRRDNDVKRYRMTEDEILEGVAEINELGIKTVILQSGEDPWYTTDKIVSIIERIKEEFGMNITLSLGERSYEEYKIFREAGANNYLLKIEAANRCLFDQINPDDDYEIRRQHTKWLKELGYITGSGGMIGLPNQTIENLAQDILFQKKYGIHMIGVGPFLPADGTPYQDYSAGDFLLSLKVVAVMRLVCQNVFIPSTTALASLTEDGQTEGLKAGANVIMLIMTPPALQENYQIYSNKNMVDLDFAIQSILEADRKIPPYINLDQLKRIDRSEINAENTTG
ncbi:iron-only hydrogenase maturation rSAM protein HydE [Halobacteroides halobius DSM 5150]|uniref:Iron-only hydrogenase maturation rSAM protein HydE n=1 Tax=Halobacteroides halobius (strain ATCC 35273 / DSM 5150 / MD-1) TaxID=748449 RepID=L0KD73_HALHC|nr:[FeFe] hydrogenase H-cluster radical SAM maturase HydE [Halobacteroides halobius]AGB42495.1 iron-only hydrogenase maturation rSAM protein HydE [Halobacteroides halobius DSM 5150]